MMNAETKYPHPRMITHFDLNNFAIKREVMLKAPTFTGLPLYRAHTVEMRKQLYTNGYSAIRVAGATGFHLPPSGFTNTFYRMLIYGSDAVAKADFYFLYGAKVVTKFSPLRRIVRIPVFMTWKTFVLLRRLCVLGYEKPSRIPILILAVPLALLFLSVVKLGCLIALFNRTYIFNKITKYESSHVV